MGAFKTPRGLSRHGRMAEDGVCGQDLPGPHAVSIPIISLWETQTGTPPTVRGQGTLAWGLPTGSGPGHLCPSFHPWGWAGPPTLGPAGISMFPAWESCSDVRSLKIEFQMSGFIRGSLKLALLLLTCAHGAGGGGAGNSLGYQRGSAAKLGGAGESLHSLA